MGKIIPFKKALNHEDVTLHTPQELVGSPAEILETRVQNQVAVAHILLDNQILRSLIVNKRKPLSAISLNEYENLFPLIKYINVEYSQHSRILVSYFVVLNAFLTLSSLKVHDHIQLGQNLEILCTEEYFSFIISKLLKEES